MGGNSPNLVTLSLMAVVKATKLFSLQTFKISPKEAGQRSHKKG
jgi:hypothetical protein